MTNLHRSKGQSIQRLVKSKWGQIFKRWLENDSKPIVIL